MEHGVNFTKAKNAIIDLEIKKVSMHKFAIRRNRQKGTMEKAYPAASKSLAAAKLAYKKAIQASDAAKLAIMMDGVKAIKL
jgi:hypothetical protein